MSLRTAYADLRCRAWIVRPAWASILVAVVGVLIFFTDQMQDVLLSGLTDWTGRQ
jgi:hypothetical protein